MSRRFALTISHHLPVATETLWPQLLDPAVWLAAWPGCLAVSPLLDGHYFVDLDLPEAPIVGRFLGRVSIANVNPTTGYDLTLALAGARGTIGGEGQVRVIDAGTHTALSLSGTIEVDGHLAALSDRLLQSSGRSLVRRALNPLGLETTAPLTPLPFQAWPPPATALPHRHPRPWLLAGGVATLLLWRARRKR